MNGLESADGQGARDRFNNTIAIIVAVISAFLAVAKTKDDNIVQAIQRSQAELTDAWNQYQAKRQRQFQLEIENGRIQAMVRDGSLKDSPENRALVEGNAREVARYRDELKELTARATEREATIARLNDVDDLFDFSDAFLTLALALLAVTALTRTRWLLLTATGIAAAGLGFGIAGFMGVTAFKPAWLAALLGA